ncbi:MAG: hypothetical protein M1813_000064 [Trichoglossum hirsutum]|nr:MAG: hypothetical protein M1813_000064 [Trichoglossum hirsutum]
MSGKSSTKTLPSPSTDLLWNQEETYHSIQSTWRARSREMGERAVKELRMLMDDWYDSSEYRLAFHSTFISIALSLMELEATTNVLSCPPGNMHPDVPLDILKTIWDMLSGEYMLPTLPLVSVESSTRSSSVRTSRRPTPV